MLEFPYFVAFIIAYAGGKKENGPRLDYLDWTWWGFAIPSGNPPEGHGLNPISIFKSKLPWATFPSNFEMTSDVIVIRKWALPSMHRSEPTKEKKCCNWFYGAASFMNEPRRKKHLQHIDPYAGWHPPFIHWFIIPNHYRYNSHKHDY